MSDNEKDIGKITAMVDFYSDRAVAHASFFLASLFGLFSVLSLAQNQHTLKCVWAIPYWLLFLGSLYTFVNFSFYATYAQKITEEADMYEVEKVKKALKRARRNLILNWFQILKNSRIKFGWGLRAVCILYLVIAFLSCWLVIGCVEAFIGLIVVSAIIAVAWLCVLYLWGENTQNS